MAESSQQICTFYLTDFLFGIEVSQVQEVIRFQALTPIPLAPYEIRGLINLRGQIVTVIDLRRRLNLPDRSLRDRPMNVIVRLDDEIVSLLVDRIGDVMTMSEETYEQPPETIDAQVREIVRGVYKLEQKLLLMLDTKKIFVLDPSGRGPA